MARPFRSGFALLAFAHCWRLAAAAGVRGQGCPKFSDDFRSHAANEDDSARVSIAFHTKSEAQLALYYVNSRGEENFVGSIVGGSPADQQSYPGHAFRLYLWPRDREDPAVVLEYRATVAKQQEIMVTVRKECLSDANQQFLDAAQAKAKEAAEFSERSEEFEALIRPGYGGNPEDYPPCLPEGQSHLWSCVRRVPRDLCESRHHNLTKLTDGNSFGFDKPQGRWKVGSYEDEQFDWQMPKIPKLSSGPGFLLLNQTKAIQEKLLPWFHEKWKKQEDVKVESPVPGGYLNDKHVPSSHVDVHRNYNMMKVIRPEMADVLTWWTNTALRHTAIFGVRVYKRGNVLLNHVDRYDTHLVSAILQVHQDVDFNAGWPVEVLNEERDCFEVYLQPGQMLLYEGAHFKHGRPMSFKGEAFGNLFVHYAPEDWHGPQMNEL